MFQQMQAMAQKQVRPVRSEMLWTQTPLKPHPMDKVEDEPLPISVHLSVSLSLPPSLYISLNLNLYLSNFLSFGKQCSRE